MPFHRFDQLGRGAIGSVVLFEPFTDLPYLFDVIGIIESLDRSQCLIGGNTSKWL